MGRNYLAHQHSDAVNAVPAAAGYNFALLINWFRQLLWLLLAWLHSGAKQRAAYCGSLFTVDASRGCLVRQLAAVEPERNRTPPSERTLS